eukprot:TRINITY_DN3036_c0_g8_i2.p1 TRINITY_DN3036_c0_g8~~TRINITY_DN3036_c0_g8_i2.p1  ORF type:complete len:695 (-),score=193.71 TRINITY_DN3036_c0_g8_i2:112-2196(-)
MERIFQVFLRRFARFPGLSSFVSKLSQRQGRLLQYKAAQVKFAEEKSQKPEEDKSKKNHNQKNLFGLFFGDDNDAYKENIFMAVTAIAFCFGIYKFWNLSRNRVVLPNKQFLSKIKEEPVSEVKFFRMGNYPTRVTAYDLAGKEIATTLAESNAALQEQIRMTKKSSPSSEKVLMKDCREVNAEELNFALFILLLVIVYFCNKRLFRHFFKNMTDSIKMQIKSKTRSMSKAVEYGPENKVNVRFKDVAGLEGPKEEIQEVVEFLRNPERFHKLGARIPRGALLTGPPGTGKTLLAKACAGEANVSFFAISGSEFVEMYVGLGAARVRNLFKKAKAKSPAVIFIDEIDAIGKERSKTGGNSERENTLNQLFVEMDGFGTDTNVVVLAATNRKKSLDPALIRPGRFDRLIEINIPTIKEREEIFNVHLQKLTIGGGHRQEDIAKRMAALSNRMSGAEIMSICNEAALGAAKVGKSGVELSDFYEAYDRVFTGLKRKLPLKSVDRKWIAYREAGRAVASWFLKSAQQVLKVSITPRSKGSLGHTAVSTKELPLYTKEQVYDALKVAYAGRAAEEVLLGTPTTGAAGDLSRATQLGRMYVESFSGKGNFADKKTQGSAHVHQVFDKEVIRVCKKAYEEVKVLVEEKKELVEKLVEVLLKKETVELDELTEILGKRDSPEYEQFSRYIEDLKEKKIAQI